MGLYGLSTNEASMLAYQSDDPPHLPVTTLSRPVEDAPGCDPASIRNLVGQMPHTAEANDALWNARAALKAIRWESGPDYALWRKVGLKRVMRFRAAAQGAVA